MIWPATTILGLALAGAGDPKEDPMPNAARPPVDLPRARDPNIAVQEELDAARRAGTVEAYDLFLARQGHHPLAEMARREREALLRRRRD